MGYIYTVDLPARGLKQINIIIPGYAMTTFIYKLDNEIFATEENVEPGSNVYTSKLLEVAIGRKLKGKLLEKLSSIIEILQLQSVCIVFNLNSVTDEFDITCETKPELKELMDALLKL